MTRARRAWVLNLDAEHELAAGTAGARPVRLESVVRRAARALRGGLVAEDDVVLDDPANRGADVRGLEGHTWCPTPSALARLVAARARPVAAPAFEVLRAVNDRGFALAVRQRLDGAGRLDETLPKVRVATLEQALERLARPAREGWLVRRAFGAAGRGRRRIAAGTPTADERDWLSASLRGGGLVLEPWVAVLREFALHGWVTPEARVASGRPCVLETDDHGAWVSTRVAAPGDLTEDECEALERGARACGEALAASGYFGPFGVDAFRFASRGREVWNPLSELNGRYTMGWSVGRVPTAP